MASVGLSVCTETPLVLREGDTLMDDTLHDASPLGGGKRDAGVVVTAAPAHPPPRNLAQRGVGNVRLPSTLSHSVYSGRAAARLVMLRVAAEELMPEAPLLVIPNGGSVPRCVDELRKAGFLSAVALNQALGVPPADEGEVVVRIAAVIAVMPVVVAGRVAEVEGMLEQQPTVEGNADKD